MTLTRIFTAFAAALVLAVTAAFSLTSSPAGAQGTAAPKAGCAGEAFKDGSGDGGGGLTSSPDNLDIIGGFFVADPGGKTKAYIQLLDSSEDVPIDATGASWYMLWTVGEEIRYVSAEVNLGASTVYSFGAYAVDSGGIGTFTPEGETSGKFFTGSKGVIEIDVPTAAGAGPGKVLKSPYAQAFASAQAPAGPGLLFFSDDAPDSMRGKDFTVGPCVAAPGGASALPVKVASKGGSAKKASKSKKVTVSLTSTEALTGLTGTLKKGAKTVGTGKLASLNGKGKMTLKLKGKVSKGSYVLELAGKNAKGEAATAKGSVKFS